jgi:hypothetical protein
MNCARNSAGPLSVFKVIRPDAIDCIILAWPSVKTRCALHRGNNN